MKLSFISYKKKTKCLMPKNGVKEQSKDGSLKITGYSEIGEHDDRTILIRCGIMEVFSKNGVPMPYLNKVISQDRDDEEEDEKVRTE